MFEVNYNAVIKDYSNYYNNANTHGLIFAALKLLKKHGFPKNPAIIINNMFNKYLEFLKSELIKKFLK